MLHIQNITKNYARHRALNNVSLRIKKGQLHGLLGPNGAGKTTLIRIINQIIAPDSGTILFEGEPLRPDHSNKIGYLPEERGLYKKMKIGDQLIYLGQLKGLSKRESKLRIREWLERLEMGDWIDKKIADLSKGMQQKVQFVATVFHEPELIILDEPFSGFDPVNAKTIQNEILKLHQKGSTIIYSTHRMESVEELCTHLSLINKSEIILDGSINEIKDAYKTQTYTLRYTEPEANLTSQLKEMCEIVENTFTPEETYIKILIKESYSLNDILKYLVDNNATLHEVKELSPTMQDIFIDQVTKTA